MGLLFRLLAPKPLKKARRSAHPISLLTPRPVRNVKRVAAKATNPVGAVGDTLENQVVRVARGSGKKRRRGSSERVNTSAGRSVSKTNALASRTKVAEENVLLIGEQAVARLKPGQSVDDLERDDI